MNFVRLFGLAGTYIADVEVVFTGGTGRFVGERGEAALQAQAVSSSLRYVGYPRGDPDMGRRPKAPR